MSSIKLYQMLVRKYPKMKHKQTAWHHICYFSYFNSLNCLNKFNIKKLLLLFVISTLIINCVNCKYNQSCNRNYLSYDENHTACKTPKDTCNVIKSGVSSYDIATIISAHNKLRNGIASGNETTNGFPSSANMILLEWDNELAAIAQSHASQCDFEHDCYRCRRTDNYEVVGQNLFLYRTSRPTLRTRWHHVIQMWYDELKIAPKSIVRQFQASQLNIGHFTQIVWANTRKIGCGFVTHAVHNSVYKVAQLYTCNYAPGGNYIGLQTYQIGPPASKCPKNAKPSYHYKALCKVYKETRIGEEERIIKKKVHLQHHNQKTGRKRIIYKKVSKSRRRYYTRYYKGKAKQKKIKA